MHIIKILMLITCMKYHKRPTFVLECVKHRPYTHSPAMPTAYITITLHVMSGVIEDARRARK